jgi:hypothetical protein
MLKSKFEEFGIRVFECSLMGVRFLPNLISFYLLIPDFSFAYPSTRRRDSVVGMTTGYGLKFWGSQTGGGEFSAPV